jgi:hypothetical protein
MTASQANSDACGSCRQAKPSAALEVPHRLKASSLGLDILDFMAARTVRLNFYIFD